MLLTRRVFSASVAACATLAPRALSAATSPRIVRFAVKRNGDQIGAHVLRFTPDGANLIVSVETEIKVKLAFVTVFRYEHDSRAVYRDNLLQELVGETYDNGEEKYVEAQRRDGTLLVEGSQTSPAQPVASESLPTTYWRRSLLACERIIDAQDGDILPNRTEHRGSERITIDGTSLDTERYFFPGKKRDVEMWYHDELWVRLAFKGPDGSNIVYEQQQPRAARRLIAEVETA